MTDAEFVEEMAARLNLVLEADPQRATHVLGTSLTHVGYASVGHFVSQLAIPRGIDPTTSPDVLKNVKFLVPVIEDGRIVKFDAVTGEELQQRHQEDAEKVAKDAQSKLLQ